MGLKKHWTFPQETNDNILTVTMTTKVQSTQPPQIRALFQETLLYVISEGKKEKKLYSLYPYIIIYVAAT